MSPTMSFLKSASLAGLLIAAATSSSASGVEESAEGPANDAAAALLAARDAPLDLSEWELAWSDEFGGGEEEFDRNWFARNGVSEAHFVRGRRWRKNIEVHDGIAEIHNIKDEADPYVWSTGSFWSQQRFGFGYFEARYKYSGASGTNNSFWLMQINPEHQQGEGACELDVNEGHYPNVINSNVHDWQSKFVRPNGDVGHVDDQQQHTFGRPDRHSVALASPVTTRTIRITSGNPKPIHIRALRIIGADGQEIAISGDAARITVSGSTDGSQPAFVSDAKDETRWVSNYGPAKWMEVSWDEPKSIAAIEIDDGAPVGNDRFSPLMTNFTVEVLDGAEWKGIAYFDSADEVDYSTDWITVGTEWDQDWIKFYHEGELFRVVRNHACFEPLNILFSMAILELHIAGEVGDDVHGTSMKVDYVRYYQRKSN